MKLAVSRKSRPASGAWSLSKQGECWHDRTRAALRFHAELIRRSDTWFLPPEPRRRTRQKRSKGEEGASRGAFSSIRKGNLPLVACYNIASPTRRSCRGPCAGATARREAMVHPGVELAMLRELMKRAEHEEAGRHRGLAAPPLNRCVSHERRRPPPAPSTWPFPRSFLWSQIQ